jgi:hypothetical protein
MDLTVDNERSVAIAGDWHGSLPWAVRAIRALATAAPDVRTILHAGDFGLFQTRECRAFLNAVDAACTSAGIERILVTPGNHEDWSWLDADFAAEPGLPVSVSRSVSVLPRGFRFELAGRTFLSFGGAASIDYKLRTSNEWWPSELPTDADVDAAIASGRAEVLITHETVNGGTLASETLLQANPQGWDFEELEYSAVSRRRITRLWHSVAPKVLFHGHMHAADEITTSDGQTVVSLGCDGQARNIGLLTLESLAWEWVDLDEQGRVRRARDVEGQYPA